MNETVKELFERKSVRLFEERPVEPEKKRLILEAALQAPSAGNMSLFTIIDVTDQSLKEKLSETCDHQPFIAKAPLVLVFCADYQKWYDVFTMCCQEEKLRKPAEGDMMLAVEDTMIGIHNAVVAAQSMGIGSCYIGDILERYEMHKEIFGLPRYVLPIGMAVFGYPTEGQKQRQKPSRFLVEDMVCENRYVRKTREEFAQMLMERQDMGSQDFDRWLDAFCKRKYNCDFSAEMSRSVREMVRSWVE